MRGLTRALIPVLGAAAIGLGALAGCSDYGDDVAAVQAAQSAGMANEAFVERLAGPNGIIDWSGRRSERYPKDSSVVLVEATVEKPTRDGQERTVVLQYHHNRTTGDVSLFDVLVDGKSQGTLGGSLQLLLMQFE